MDFNDTPEEASFRSECRSWLEANAEPLSTDEADVAVLEERSDPGTIQRAQAWQAKKADAGWACMTGPKEYGGRGATAIQSVIWGQEERRFRTPPNIFAIGQGMLGPTIMAHGTEAQKSRYLEPLLRGDEIWCQLFSEPGAGSDLAALRTTAVRHGDVIGRVDRAWRCSVLGFMRWPCHACRRSAVRHSRSNVLWSISIRLRCLPAALQFLD